MKGEFQHNIDAKGRLAIPAKFRDELGQNFIVTKGLDGCLFVYSMEDWAILEDKIKSMPMSKSRDLQRFFFSAATDCELDSQGRILIPANLRKYAQLEKEVAIIGVSGRAEIWNSDKWNGYNEEITSDSIAEAMEDIGF